VKYYKGMRISLWRIYIVFLLLAIAEGGGVMWYDAYKRMSEYSSVWNEEDSFEGFFWGDEYPPHEVTISLPYYLGKYEVTQSQYEVIMGDNPSQWRNINKPVEMIPWNMAKEFCRRMTDRIGRECRLPSEAEWEYACRAGKNKQLCIAKPRNIKSAIGWYADNSEGMTHSVGQKAPNGFGLYDMLGNVSEWCEDVRHKSYVGAPSDGRAWVGNDTDAHRICRGGSYDSSIQCCRATDRSSGFANYGMSVIGFRVLMSIFQETETFTR
jgi:formylglycine-generating enzyme required for sulfatase activity